MFWACDGNVYACLEHFLLIVNYQWVHTLVGVSLSEPHTSVTALHTRVCIWLAIYLWTNHF